MIQRPWAFWRRVQYIGGFLFVLLLVSTGVYFGYFYESANCFDGSRNGDERGIDCGGACARLCVMDVLSPTPLWAEAFRVTDGQYNAVAYVENTNLTVGTPELRYTITLYDSGGVIAERSGSTVLPPDSVYPIFEGRINTGTRIPTRTEIALAPAEDWFTADAGREQFVIESRQISNINSSPRLDASITNTALTEAADVEIVATIFDSQGVALTASRTVVPRFAARATQDVVFTWPEAIAKTIRSCEVPIDVLLGVDLSGSMNDDGGDPPQPITAVLDAAGSFVDRLRADDQAGVVTYATDARLTNELTPDTTTVAASVAGLGIASAEETGSTNTGDAFGVAQTELSSDRQNPDARKVFVLLSDGLATAPGDDPAEYAREAAVALKQDGVEIFTIGLGANVDAAFLAEISSGDGYHFQAASVSTIDTIYRSVTEAICQDGPAVIEIVPKTATSFIRE